ncbi:MAG TPA: chemotaxis protein CheW [Vicinamibacterales bacterium]|jgi:purine-binding chemotaxis protein CheW|nr:chemotaxis protein CheW [Vicinamibacterales bacterium]
MTDGQQAADRFILFTVAGTTYAVHSHDVHHMEMIEEVTRVPNAPPFVDGVVFSRGHVIPVVNLRARFGFERVPHTLRTRLVVVQAAAGRIVGLIADEAREFVVLPAHAIQPPHDTLAGLSGRYLQGIASVGDRMILVLNLERVLDFGAIAAAGEPPVADAASA